MEFFFYTRYDAETYQGVLLDTGAAGVSTAGEIQVKALPKKTANTIIDHTTAGNHSIWFGDGNKIDSVGSISIDTTIVIQKFQVIPKTPHLYCVVRA